VKSTCREALEQTLLFGALEDDALDELAGVCVARSYLPGQMVVVAGDAGGDVLVVAEGKVKVLARSPEGNDVVLNIAVAGDTLGEVSLFDREPRSATIEAAERTVVVRVPGDVVRDLIRTTPDLAEELLRQQAALLRRSSGMVADLVFLDLPRRVAKYVVSRTKQDGKVDLGMSQSELAAAVGGVRQSVNSALRGFERRGWIALDGRTVEVRDKQALARYAAVEL
jgi:CRP-like cAMP-binding protein